MTNGERRRRVVITGASGRLGRLLQAHLGRANRYDLVLLDRAAGTEPGVHGADLSRYSTDWGALFEGADAVVHLAGDPGRAATPWPQLIADNVEATHNVYHAAALNAVPRVVYASTLQTMEGHRFGDGPIAADAPARPVVPYAATKLIGESVAKYFSEAHGVSTLCLRIGSVPSSPAETGEDWTAWRHSKWLSAGDLCDAFEKAIVAADVRFAALTLVSDNPGMRWDLSETRRVLGYDPSSGTPSPSPGKLAGIRSTLGMLHKRFFDPAWRQYWD